MKVTTRAQTQKMEQEQEILKLRKECQELRENNFEQVVLIEELQGITMELEIENQELNRKIREMTRRESILKEKYKRRTKYLKKDNKKFYAKSWKFELKYKDE